MGNFSIAVFFLMMSLGIFPNQTFAASTDEYPPSQDSIVNGTYEWARSDLILATINGKQYRFIDSDPYDNTLRYEINSQQSICDGKISFSDNSPTSKAKIDIDFGPTCNQTNPNAIEKVIAKSENANVWFVWFNQDSIVQVSDNGNTDRQYVRESAGSSVFVQKGVDNCADKLILRSGTPAYVNLYRFDGEEGSSPQDLISAGDLGLLKPAGCKLYSTYVVGGKRDKIVNYGLGETQNAGVAPSDKPLGGESGGNSDNPSCEGSIDNGFGWIICPALDLIDKFISGTEAIIASKLAVDTGTFDDSLDTGSDLRETWTVMARVASGLLVIVALFMIFSTALNFDFVSAYTLKKVLPRIVIGAIGIWLSWPLVVTYVSFMNDLGRGVASLMYSAFPNDIKSIGLEGIVAIAAQSSGMGTDIAAGALFTGLAAASIGSIGIFGLIAAAIAVATAILVGIFVLAIREMLIIVFVVFAPIAIASWILPNTSKIWKFWSSNFNKLLLMFPMIMALFASAKIVAYVSAKAANANTGFLEVLFPLIIYVTPFFFLPKLFKSAGGILTGITGAVNKAGARTTGGVQKSVQGLADARKKVKADQRAASGRIATGSGYRVPFTDKRLASTAMLARAAQRAKAGQAYIPISSGSRTAAALQYSRTSQSNVLAMQKEIEETAGGDLDARKAIASGATLESLSSELRQDGTRKTTEDYAKDTALATRMKANGTSRYLGDRYAQAGATLGLAAMGRADEKHISTMASNFGDDQQTASALVSQSTRSAKSAGQLSVGNMKYDYTTGSVGYEYVDSTGKESIVTEASPEYQAARLIQTRNSLRTMSASDLSGLATKIDDDGNAVFKDPVVQEVFSSDTDLANRVLRDENVKLTEQTKDVLKSLGAEPLPIPVQEVRVVSDENNVSPGAPSANIPPTTTNLPNPASPAGQLNPQIILPQQQPSGSPSTSQINVEPARLYEREVWKSMGHENVQRAIISRGGIQALNEADLLSIANEYGGETAGEAARSELRNRGILSEDSGVERPLP